MRQTTHLVVMVVAFVTAAGVVVVVVAVVVIVTSVLMVMRIMGVLEALLLFLDPLLPSRLLHNSDRYSLPLLRRVHRFLFPFYTCSFVIFCKRRCPAAASLFPGSNSGGLLFGKDWFVWFFLRFRGGGCLLRLGPEF